MINLNIRTRHQIIERRNEIFKMLDSYHVDYVRKQELKAELVELENELKEIIAEEKSY